MSVGGGPGANRTGENTGDSGQQTGVIGSSGKGRGTLINTGFRALQSQPQ